MNYILLIIKYAKIGKIIFGLTEDALEIVNDKKLDNREKGIEILKVIPNNLLELGKD